LAGESRFTPQPSSRRRAEAQEREGCAAAPAA
jgi:hypothetical protein